MVEIGVLGLGNVGGAVVDLLTGDREEASRRLGTDVRVKKVLVRSLDRSTKRPVDDRCRDLLTVEPDDILRDDGISIVVEVLGGAEPAFTYIKQALRSGKSVVTANKEVVAAHGEELAYLASQAGARLLFEASVGGGIPVIRPLRGCLASSRMSAVVGILNGTTNYILSKMDEDGLEMSDALQAAQELGYAEADPSDDVNGADAKRKLAILASLAYNALVLPDQIDACGIERVSKADIQSAAELGYVIKLVAASRRRGESIELSVGPALLPPGHLLAPVKDTFNAVILEGDTVGTLMFYGRGAGGIPTAGAVLSDIDEIISGQGTAPTAFSCLDRLPLLDPRLQVSPFYVRLNAIDRPGALAAISSVFGRHGVNLSKVNQKNLQRGVAQVVMVTHAVEKGRLEDALADLIGCAQVVGVSSYMRVWEQKT